MERGWHFKAMVAGVLGVHLLAMAACSPAPAPPEPAQVPAAPPWPAAVPQAPTPPSPRPAPLCLVAGALVPVPSMGPRAGTTAAGEPASTPPVVARAARAGVEFEVRLPADTFLAGEAVMAELVVRNGTQQPVSSFDPRVMLSDEQGRPPPHRGFLPGDWPEPRPFVGPDRLDPGQVVTQRQLVQLPFEDQAVGHSFDLRGAVPLGNPAAPLDDPMQWPELAAGPIPLRLVSPTPAQTLRPEWRADRRQWCLRATDGDGRKPTAPLSAWMWVVAGWGRSLGPLQGGTGDMWAGYWLPQFLRGDGPFSVSVWIAGPGYVTALLTETVPGTATAP